MISSRLLMDWLLESLELEANLFHVGRYCGDWHANTSEITRSSFHLVVQGQCWLHVHGQAHPYALSAGDAVFMLRDFKYWLSNSENAQNAQRFPAIDMVPLDSGAENGVGLVCGFFHFKTGLSSMIIDGLPDWIILRADEPSVQAARVIFELILQECERPSAPSSLLLERLSHLLFLYVLRQQIADNHELGGLVALARHPSFAPLLDQLIKQPQAAWSLDTMATVTGLSRSAFFKRFTDLAHQSPGQVLLALRIRHACQLLKSNHTVEAVCPAVGYQSISAFTRAFVKSVGMQPGAFRKKHQASER
ncbi:AraC family transcriptional regulator [Pseudomonas gregormendelii]|uniref:AraC family transcriptional regulator n=1 Tax=Pseudomonas gregormendelii TaxID=1628277 RepID=A0ABS3APC3_9PSED|nr:AraC family transcriptional regulator [Pseudomonas gregormendelii]MBN3968609.1 AraC family transcriptional regulator [Pseudomonas gregormendelii]